MENDENTAEMEQQENENHEGQEQEETQEQDQSQDGSDSNEDDTDWKAEALKYKAILARNKNKSPEKKEPMRVAQSLDDATMARIYGVHEDDFQEVKDMAALKRVSIAEALKLGTTKAILAEKAEFRKTAEVSNTGNARRGATTVSPDTLLNNLSEGKVPAKGSKEAEDLFWAKRGGKR